MEATNPNPEHEVRRRGRPRTCFEVKVKRPRGRPVGSVNKTVLHRTKEEISEIRRLRAKLYFERNPEQVVKSRESYRRYYERNKVEINERRTAKKREIMDEKS